MDPGYMLDIHSLAEKMVKEGQMDRKVAYSVLLAEDAWTCPGCQEQMPREAKYCMNCGSSRS